MDDEFTDVTGSLGDASVSTGVGGVFPDTINSSIGDTGSTISDVAGTVQAYGGSILNGLATIFRTFQSGADQRYAQTAQLQGGSFTRRLSTLTSSKLVLYVIIGLIAYLVIKGIK